MHLTKEQLKQMDREELDRLHERAARPRTPAPLGVPVELDPATVAEMARGERSRAHAALVLAEVRAEAEAAAAPARAEAARLTDALESARGEHLGALAELEKLGAQVHTAIVAGRGVQAAEDALRAGQARVDTLARRVLVLEGALRDATQAADDAFTAAAGDACRRRLGDAQAAEAAGKADLTALRARHLAELNAALDAYDLALTLAARLAGHAGGHPLPGGAR